MIEVSESEFEKIVAEAIDSLPAQIEHVRNLAVVVENEPSPEQQAKLHLVNGRLLFGLYEGIPLIKRGAGYNMVLPDKITIFKRPLEIISRDLDELKAQVRHTVWHEIAHHYGLNHDQIHALESKQA